MPHPFFAVFHAGQGHEVSLLAYLHRVLLHLFAVGVIAVLAFWWSRVVETIRSAFPPGRDGDEGGG